MTGAFALECLTSGQRVVLAVSGCSENKEPLNEFWRKPLGTISSLDRLRTSPDRNGVHEGPA